MIDANTLFSALEKIKDRAPLIHNITNYVVMNNSANALLALGASPVMAHAAEEVEEMTALAACLVLNMGTLSEKWVESMLMAGKTAQKKQIPIVFDPVGVGATTYRTQTAKRIIEECKPSIIRGNASEIMALCQSGITTKGVDSTHASESALQAAIQLANAHNAVVVISGETDYITNGQAVYSIANGSPLMAKVTGMGCTATAVVGAFAGIEKDLLTATSMAMAVMGLAGQLAVTKSNGPGSLQLNFLDALYSLSAEDIKTHLKVRYESL